MKLRDYQEDLIEKVREQFRNGKRAVVLYAPVGAGKTEISIALLNAAKQKNNRSAMVLDRIVLVNQTSERLDKYTIDHGVLQSGHWRFRPYEHIQICSAQTLERRGKMENVSLMIIDECHDIRRQTAEFIKANPHIRVVGLSATPFSKGMGKIYDGIVSSVTTNQLIERRVLVPLRVFISKEIDMTGAKKVGGEWTEAEAGERGIKIVGDVVAEWIAKTYEVFGKPVKTIAFCSGVAHGIELAKKFQENGFNFICVSYKDDEKFKADVIEEFKKPDSKIHGLIATDILTKGFDDPSVLCGISARPFSKSLKSHMQQKGRVMRGAPGKDFGLWICFSGNYLRFREQCDQIYQDGVNELNEDKEKPKKEPTKKEKEDSKCPKCNVLWEKGWKACGHCGHIVIRQTLIEAVPGKLVELKNATRDERQRFWSMMRYKVLIDGWSDGRASHTFKDRFGSWPNGLDDKQVIKPSDECEAFCKELLKKYLRKVHAIRGKKK